MEKKPNNFIVFIKSMLPMLLAWSIMLAVNFVIIIIISIKAYSQNISLYLEGEAEAFQTAFLIDYTTLASTPLVNTVTTISVYVLLAVVFGLWFFKSDLSKDMTPLKKALPFRNIVLIVLSGYFTQFGIDMLLGLILPLFPKIEADYEQLIDSLTGSYTAITAVATVLLAPFAEELVFRGMTFKGTRRYWKSFVLVNTLQALYFGIYHGNIVQGVYAFAMGLLLGYVAYKLNNIFASMLFHASINLSSYFMFLPDALADRKLIWLLIAIICAGIVWGFMYLLKIPEAAEAGSQNSGPIIPKKVVPTDDFLRYNENVNSEPVKMPEIIGEIKEEQPDSTDEGENKEQ